MRAAIQLSFGMVSGVTPGIHVLDGGPHASREGWILGRLPHRSSGFSGIFRNRNVFDSCVKS